MADLTAGLASIYRPAIEGWLLSVALVALFSALEGWRPAEHTHTVRGRARNLVFSLFYLLLGTVLVYPLLRLAGGLPTIADGGRSVADSVVAVFAALLLTDLCYYWYHRAQHHFASLWLVHELHHADAELNATTSWRTHFLEQPLQLLAITFPAIYLVHHIPGLEFARLTVGELTVYYHLASLWLVLGHANLRLGFGPATILVTGPQYHRLHHSTVPEHLDKNFAQYFPFIDRAFGTYHHPARDDYPATGTPELASDAPPLTAAARPFVVWGKRLLGRKGIVRRD